MAQNLSRVESWLVTVLFFILAKLLGRQCQDIDECRHANPCVHGKCHNLIGSFYCDCIETGFTGKICDEDLDECKCAEGDGEYALRQIFKFNFYFEILKLSR